MPDGDPDSGPVTLALLRSDITHGFEKVNTRLDGLADGQREQAEDLKEAKGRIDCNEKAIALLLATTIRWDNVKATAIITAVITVILIAAGVGAKVAGIF